MNELREKLLDRMIRLYNFEDEMVIQFAEMCESYPNNEQYDKCLSALVKCHEEEKIKETY